MEKWFYPVIVFANIPLDFIAILIFLAVAVPLLGRYRIQQLLSVPTTTSRQRFRLYGSTILSQWLAVAVILWRCRAHNVALGELGVGNPQPTLTGVVTLVLAGLLLLNQLLSIRELGKHPERLTGAMHQVAMRIFPHSGPERVAFFPVVVTVSICEEVIYRGFVQRAFQDASGGRVLVGVLASAVFFGSAHLYQGKQGVAATGLMGLIFSGVRAWTRSLLPCVVAHFVTDITVGLLAPAKLAALKTSEALLE